jgi:hypothetical protein
MPNAPRKPWEATDDEIRSLKAENPGAALAEVGFPEYEQSFIVRAPSQPEWSAHRTESEASTTPYDIAAAFVARHIVKPDLGEAQRRFEEHPAIVERIRAQLMKLGGAVTEVTVKKL